VKRYPEDYNPILEYWEQMCSGRIAVSRKVRATYDKLVRDIREPGEWHYSPKRGNHILEFAENFCRHSKGKLGGQLVELELWEKAMLAAVFGFVNDKGIRRYQRAVLIVGKKNGKSLLASVVGNYMQQADGEPGPEIYAVATKRDQAKIIWLEAKRMVKKSPPLLKRSRVLTGSIETDFNDGTFKPLASDQDTLDGLNVHCVLMDEIHQWQNGRALYDIMADGITAREQPLIFITSTAGVVREDIYDEIYDEGRRTIDGYSGGDDAYRDDRSIFFIYELDKREEWDDPKCWRKANPGLGTIKNQRTLSEKVEKAKQNSSLLRNLLCKEFNIPSTTSQAWLNFDELVNEAIYDIAELKPRYFIGGADLSSTNDLTAAKALFMLPDDPRIYSAAMYWIPEDLVERKVKDDKIRYDIWIEKGWCRTCPGNKMDYHAVTDWFRELRDKFDIYPMYIGYDSRSATYWVNEMKQEFGPACMVPVIQGKKTLSAPMKSLGADLKAKRINYNNNPIDRWCLANTAVDEDRNGNIQPIKTTRSTRRIDGTAALLDAYVVLTDKMEEYQTMI
jgi:phage terminase large subunit-like protein